jgi:hypothetical protein
LIAALRSHAAKTGDELDVAVIDLIALQAHNTGAARRVWRNYRAAEQETMNSRQTRVLVVGFWLFAGSIVLPPWRLRTEIAANYGVADRVRYSPMWMTPYIIPKGERYKVYLTVDLPLLAIEWGVIAAATAGLAIFLGKSRPKSTRTYPP